MSTPIKLFIVCSGLGHINRGFESFTQECFDALSGEPELDLTLFKGGGPSDKKQVVLWNLPRNAPLTERLGRITGKGGYWLEQVTFTLSLLPHIARQKPAVIYFSDCNIGNLLWHWRRLTRQNYKLLLSNGGPLSPPFPRWDFVQQVAPSHVEAALVVGQDANKQGLVPYGIHMEAEPQTLSPEERTRMRQELGLPEDRPIILSVGAVNKGHKRMDYVIREVAALTGVHPYLVILGQVDEETLEVRALAEQMLGNGHFQIRTVPHEEIAAYYQSADVFVLASLNEGFGRVFLEALSWGVPCLAHDYVLTRYVLGDAGLLADLEKQGSLTRLICQALQHRGVLSREERHRMAFNRFSWAHLRPEYVALIQKCAAF